MSRAKLLSVSLERFKSYGTLTEFELKPLTVVVGRNNSGKSTVIQALLLLQQTLKQTRSDVALHLEGAVDAINLRELTTHWPDQLSDNVGPTITLRWSTMAGQRAWPGEISDKLGLTFPRNKPQTTELRLQFGERSDTPVLTRFELHSENRQPRRNGPSVIGTRNDDGSFGLEMKGFHPEFDAELDQLRLDVRRFVPFLELDSRRLAPRAKQRSLFNAYELLFAQPLEDLVQLLESMTYLRSIREAPPSLYRPAAGKADDLGVSGEHAAKLLHARQSDLVHYPRPVKVDNTTAHAPTTIEERPLVEAVNDILAELGVTGSVRIDDIRNVGFRLLFGNATLQHVGRGLTYLLPIIEYGLITDPLRWKKSDARTIDEYLAALDHFTLAAIEEPEAHLHPKVQSRLAHWLVALAMSGRRLIVETHSDHFVRRLRGIAARAAPGSALEQWIKDNVAIYMVEQGDDGMSTAKRATLTNVGRIDAWPSDFMDEATDEERAIADAALDKTPEPSAPSAFTVEHMGDEP